MYDRFLLWHLLRVLDVRIPDHALGFVLPSDLAVQPKSLGILPVDFTGRYIVCPSTPLHRARVGNFGEEIVGLESQRVAAVIHGEIVAS